MKKFFSITLVLMLLFTVVCVPAMADNNSQGGGATPSVPSNPGQVPGNVTQDDIDDLKIPGDLAGSAVDVPTDIKISAEGGAYAEVYQDTAFAGTELNLDFKATIDMEPVRQKFLDYMRYAEALEQVMTDDEINQVVVDGEFEVYIKMSPEMGAVVEGLTPDIADNPIINPVDDMAGFTLESANGVSVTDVYTEEGYSRSWTQDSETGEYILGVTLKSKSPTGNGPLTAGDLKEGVGAPYATLDYEDYLADVTFVVEDIVYPVSGTPLKDTVWGYIEGRTDFYFANSLTQEIVEITHVLYESVQLEGAEDTLVTWEPEFEDDAVKSKRVSTTFELRGANQIKLTFIVAGKYLVPPADGDAEYNNIIPPVYGDTEINFDASEYKITKSHGKRTKYTFRGWSLIPDGGLNDVIGDTVFTEDTVLYAVFTAATSPAGPGGGGTAAITVNFCVDGEYDVVAPITGNAPIKVVFDELEVPEKEGFKFDGWYADGAYTNKVADPFSTSVSTTLYARYVRSDVPGTLDGDIHFAYVIGYPEGDVRPENNISREEVTTIFYRLLKKDVRDGIFTDVNNFSDVEADRWSNKAVSTMAKGGYVKGYDDGSFRPEDYITRAEFATIAARFLEDKTSVRANFSDISGHWAESYIKLVAGNGWVSGYEDGTFKPDNYITRAEAMAIINRILVRYVNGQGLHADTKQWPDNAASAWYYYDVLEATNAHDFERQADGIHETWTSINENNVWAEKPEYEDAE